MSGTAEAERRFDAAVGKVLMLASSIAHDLVPTLQMNETFIRDIGEIEETVQSISQNLAEMRSIYSLRMQAA